MFHPEGIDADRGKTILARFVTQLLNLGAAGFGFEQRVINETGDIAAA